MKTAIMIVSHGAKESEGRDSAIINAKKLQESTGLEVYIGYIHLEPSITHTLDIMCEDGVERVIAVPLFMYPGFIPDVKVRREFGMDPGCMRGSYLSGGNELAIEFTGTFGNHEGIYDVIKSVISENDGSAEKTSLLLLFHGSKSTELNADIANCASHFRSLGYDILCAYNEFQHPTVEEGLEWAERTKKDVLAIPMFVSPGSHTLEDIPPKLGLEGSGRTRTLDSGKKLSYCEEIGMHPGISEILAARVKEVLQ